MSPKRLTKQLQPTAGRARLPAHNTLTKSARAEIINAIGYAKFYSRSRDAVIRACDESGNVIETHEHAGDFKEW
jgi:hypothetical protein